MVLGSQAAFARLASGASYSSIVCAARGWWCVVARDGGVVFDFDSHRRRAGVCVRGTAGACSAHVYFSTRAQAEAERNEICSVDLVTGEARLLPRSGALCAKQVLGYSMPRQFQSIRAPHRPQAHTSPPPTHTHTRVRRRRERILHRLGGGERNAGARVDGEWWEAAFDGPRALALVWNDTVLLVAERGAMREVDVATLRDTPEEE